MVKPPDKLRRQMRLRGWTAEQIAEAKWRGERHRAVNRETGGPATRYVHPETSRSVVIDDGGDGFIY